MNIIIIDIYISSNRLKHFHYIIINIILEYDELVDYNNINDPHNISYIDDLNIELKMETDYDLSNYDLTNKQLISKPYTESVEIISFEFICVQIYNIEAKLNDSIEMDIIKNIYLHIELDIPFNELSELEKQKIFNSDICIKIGFNEYPISRKISDLVLLTNIMNQPSILKDNIIQLCLADYDYIHNQFNEHNLNGLMQSFRTSNSYISINSDSSYINASNKCQIQINGYTLDYDMHNQLLQSQKKIIQRVYLDIAQNKTSFNHGQNIITIDKYLQNLTKVFIFNFDKLNEDDNYLDIKMIKVSYFINQYIHEKIFNIEDLIVIELYNNKYYLLSLSDDFNTIEKIKYWFSNRESPKAEYLKIKSIDIHIENDNCYDNKYMILNYINIHMNRYCYYNKMII